MLTILLDEFKADSWKDQQNYQRNRTQRAWTAGTRSCFWGCWIKGSYSIFKKAGLEIKRYLDSQQYFIIIPLFIQKNLLVQSTPENKLRLLMIYAIVYPEKFEGDRASKLIQVIINS